MSKLEQIERAVSALSREELETFRAWFARYDAATWDSQFEADAKSGKLDALAEDAVADFRAGRARPL